MLALQHVFRLGNSCQLNVFALRIKNDKTPVRIADPRRPGRHSSASRTSLERGSEVTPVDITLFVLKRLWELREISEIEFRRRAEELLNLYAESRKGDSK